MYKKIKRNLERKEINFAFLSSLKTTQDMEMVPTVASGVSENVNTVTENVNIKEKSEETPSPSFASPIGASPLAASPVTNGSVITSNGNESETTNRNTSVEDSANDDLIDAIIANAVAAVNGEVVAASAMNMCPEAIVSPTEGE